MEDRSTGGQFSGGASGSASWEGYSESPPLPFPPRRFPDYSPDFYREDRFQATNNEGLLTSNNRHGSAASTDDVKSCFVVSTAFSFFVSICLAFGLYGSETLKLGSNTSALINPNHLFVDSIKVAELDVAEGPVLYGFYKTPRLDVMDVWSEDHTVTLPSNFHKEWVYYLNEGSQLSINYTVESLSSLVLAILEGEEGLAKWLEDPSNPNTASSWNIIYGNGLIQKDITKSTSYYIAVGNLNDEAIKVDLSSRIKALLYNTTGPYYTCRPAYGECNFKLFWLGGNAAVLTSPRLLPGTSKVNWRVKLSYGARWMTYVLGTGAMISLLVLINYFLNHFQRTRRHRTRDNQSGESRAERNPLISNESDKHSSRSSSFDSASEGEGFLEDAKPGADKPGRDEEDSRRLCAICFEDPKDCFFLPCGHCVSCHGCATKVLEASGSCPICRRRIKKFRKIAP
ncbi:E3 ubiquitin-protein ligase APD2 isoform X2 [Andrographis paniculata]|uniref:E3 ubiquitin-protein ligase APD2 isoform X2 n=1 Tax=Andrographis paniculata TaxID=175694 RepID=UPI0021E91CF2|nr:E3 ubiquitin-protein ligase APD2 isoform X2 [Andrographis paniculata]